MVKDHSDSERGSPLSQVKGNARDILYIILVLFITGV